MAQASGTHLSFADLNYVRLWIRIESTLMNKLGKLLQRQSPLWIGTLGAFLVTAIAPQLSHAVAVQLSDGSTMFTSPPRLVDFVTLENSAGRKNVTYYLVVNLLPEAGEPLKTLKVSLLEGRFTRLDYRTADIEVFAGDRRDRGTRYPVESAEYDDSSQTLTIRLETAIPPGQQFTVALAPVRNPTREGVYLFEVTAAPDGEQPVFQRVGIGRIHIFRDPLLNFGLGH